MGEHDPLVEPNFTRGDPKPGVDEYGKEYKFSPNDRVYLKISGAKEGPYKVESVEDGKYRLCDDVGKTARGGQTFAESDLELYDPFT